MNHKFYLRLYDISFEVTKEQYEEYYRERRRAKYLEEVDIANGLAYYQALDTDSYLGEELIRNKTQLTEDIVENEDLIEKMLKSLEQLSEKEKELIKEIFFSGKTERELSAETGIPQTTISYRKQQILKKLKKLLEN